MYMPIWALAVLSLLAILGLVSSLGIYILSECLPDQAGK